MKKISLILSILYLFIGNLFAYEYKAFGVGGDMEFSKTEINIKGDVYTLLPFSSLYLDIENVNKDGEYTVFIGKINGEESNPIKVSSNYKNEYIIIKLFKGNTKFNETTFITQSSEIYIDDSYEFFDITLK